ncbi:Macrolide export protein MacA [Rubripirellula lacrimiformis]|uniref:Macrolide export protein MacA n=1 Tax=Rubripirellula lacrimiformis TaxID=1930273 RepID=A0A517N3S5_9BACT|nr:HlyD family efflux transporter periplasmic adaptor subunit [Rubripirellula lacrimiformis]QDT01784.1 Macrolide export protein MacA [Rubripirellula lacrimiformis]
MFFRLTRSSGIDRRGGIMGGLLVCLILVGVIGAVGYRFFYDSAANSVTKDLITASVSRGPFDHIVLEQGEIESSSNTEVICEVKSRGSAGTAILWVIDEGTRVKKGDKLVELDSSELEVRLKEQRIQVITEEARVTTAQAQLEQAKISKEEYLEGVFKTDEKALLSEEAVANQNLLKARLAIESSRRLVAKGLVKELQLQADQFAMINANNQLSSTQGRLQVLRNLTKQKMLVQFNSEIEAAAAALSAANSELMEEQNELDDIELQIEKCVMYAPSEGVVVHANRFSSRGGNAEFVVEAGSTVRERQAIIRLPDPTQMQVKCNINESRITLVRAGMPAKIALDAIAGMKLQGVVKKVNRYAEPNGFFGSSIKEYATIIEILNPPENIRTGMTSEVQIFVEQLENALQIPIQGLYDHGGELFTLVQRGPNSFETVAVTIGATNDTMASIASGLEEGDKVVLNLREHLSLMDLPEIADEDNSEMRELGANNKHTGGAAVPAEAGEGGPRGPGEGRPRGPGGDRGPGGERGPRDGAGGRGPGGGGPGGGGPGGGGGAPDPNQMVSRSMQSNDTDGDGSLSADEISKIDERFRSNISAADEDGDGSVTRAELLKSMKARFSGGGGRPE